MTVTGLPTVLFSFVREGPSLGVARRTGAAPPLSAQRSPKYVVILGLGPRIHVFRRGVQKAWMPGPRPGMTVEGLPTVLFPSCGRALPWGRSPDRRSRPSAQRSPKYVVILGLGPRIHVNLSLAACKRRLMPPASKAGHDGGARALSLTVLFGRL